MGDYIKQQPGYFEQITPKPIDATPWVLEDGMRLPMYMEVECSAKDLHSGVFGGTVHEGMADLISMMDTLIDKDGKIIESKL